MANFFFAESLDKLAPLFKSWVKEAIQEMAPALIEVHDSSEQTGIADEYLSPDEVSKLLGISTPTLRKYTRIGIYTAYRVGKRKLQYRRSEIEKAIEARRIDHN